MQIEARIDNRHQRHVVSLSTNGSAHAIEIAPRPSGFGSSANGGELLCLALATCYCNDLYREAERRGIVVERVEVEAEAQFGKEGEPAQGLRYRARVAARAAESDIRELMLHTDRVAEVQNTLRTGREVAFEIAEARQTA